MPSDDAERHVRKVYSLATAWLGDDASQLFGRCERLQLLALAAKVLRLLGSEKLGQGVDGQVLDTAREWARSVTYARAPLAHPPDDWKDALMVLRDAAVSVPGPGGPESRPDPREREDVVRQVARAVGVLSMALPCPSGPDADPALPPAPAAPAILVPSTPTVVRSTPTRARPTPILVRSTPTPARGPSAPAAAVDRRRGGRPRLWTAEEDRRLVEGHRRHGSAWRSIRTSCGLQHYTSLQVRDRFRNILRARAAAARPARTPRALPSGNPDPPEVQRGAADIFYSDSGAVVPVGRGAASAAPVPASAAARESVPAQQRGTRGEPSGAGRPVPVQMPARRRWRVSKLFGSRRRDAGGGDRASGTSVATTTIVVAPPPLPAQPPPPPTPGAQEDDDDSQPCRRRRRTKGRSVCAPSA